MPVPLDLLHQRFGRLTVIAREPSRSKNSRWLCRCDCGRTVVATGSNLSRGNTLSCGCLARELRPVYARMGREAPRIAHPNNRNVRDLIGKTFGRLTVVEFAESRSGHAYWRCRCRCGTERIIRGSKLVGGRIVSCGCAKRSPEVRRQARTQVPEDRREQIARRAARTRWGK